MLVVTSLIYRTEPKQKPEMPKNGEQPESVVSVREKETGPIYVVVLAGNFHYDLSRNHNRLTSRGQSVLGTSYYTV